MATLKMRSEMAQQVTLHIRYRAREAGLDPETDGRVVAWRANRHRALDKALANNDWSGAASVLTGVGHSGPCGHNDDLDEMETYYERICYDQEALRILREWRAAVEA
jgi:hypothetical protein